LLANNDDGDDDDDDDVICQLLQQALLAASQAGNSSAKLLACLSQTSSTTASSVLQSATPTALISSVNPVSSASAAVAGGNKVMPLVPHSASLPAVALAAAANGNISSLTHITPNINQLLPSKFRTVNLQIRSEALCFRVVCPSVRVYVHMSLSRQRRSRTSLSSTSSLLVCAHCLRSSFHSSLFSLLLLLTHNLVAFLSEHGLVVGPVDFWV